MLTDAKLLQLVYDAATCYVPTEQLNEEQLERLDNITYRWCNCRRCKKALKIGDETIRPQYVGHANKRTLEICLSRSFLRKRVDMPYAMFLLELIGIALHEVVHILFPEFNEEETIDKTWVCLKNNEWVAHWEKVWDSQIS